MDKKIKGTIKILTGIGSEEQLSSYMNGTQSGVGTKSVCIASYPPKDLVESGQPTEKELAKFLKNALQGLVDNGWVFEIQIGEDE
jgi:hypothetical protein